MRHGRRPNNHKLFYAATWFLRGTQSDLDVEGDVAPPVVSYALSNDGLVSTSEYRRQDWNNDREEGYAVVNVDVQSKAGTHWVVAEWSRKDSRVELRLLDPMVDTAGAEQIKKIVTAQSALSNACHCYGIKMAIWGGRLALWLLFVGLYSIYEPCSWGSDASVIIPTIILSGGHRWADDS